MHETDVRQSLFHPRIPPLVGSTRTTRRHHVLTCRRTILYAPFTPFTILFCHVIETSDTKDLERLGQFAASLQPVSSLSPAIDRFQHLCKVLHQIATLYVEAKSQAQQDHGMVVVGNDFDVYFSQLGFIPELRPAESLVSGLDLGPRLEDWFTGNRSIMGLMEEDLSFFDTADCGDWSTTGSR